MTYAVYGLRLNGDKEVRYVGFTRKGEQRLRQHFYMNAYRAGSPMADWLRENRKTVEFFTIWEADTSGMALALERGTIEMCLRLGHRLFNHIHVAPELRIVRSA